MKIPIEPEQAQTALLQTKAVHINRLPAALFGIGIVLTIGFVYLFYTPTSSTATLMPQALEVVINESGILPPTLLYQSETALRFKNTLQKPVLVNLGTLCYESTCQFLLEANATMTIPLGALTTTQTFYVTHAKEFTGTIAVK